MHFSEGSYEKIAQRFYTNLNYDIFFLEYDDPRSGGLEPLRFLHVLEAAEIIAQGPGRSVDEVMADIGVSPQCGFASVAVGADGMTEDKMFCQAEAGE
ncbi:hypothetical protein EsDP_00002379 [Epichloe bromicola]|uniref:Uncharacterized protein n=1 Tax=Epichloe bromicola TaxID=79588 RepID=A0ABQ0CKP1_9HYPO